MSARFSPPQCLRCGIGPNGAPLYAVSITRPVTRRDGVRVTRCIPGQLCQRCAAELIAASDRARADWLADELQDLQLTSSRAI